MKLQEVNNFLKKFNIEEQKIREYTKDKEIVKINENIFLTKKKLDKNQIYTDGLIFIKLKKLLPSKFLLEFIKNNSENQVNVKGEKQALNFSYGKDLSLDSIKSKMKFNSNQFYLATYENEELGYFQFNKTNKQHPIKVIMNIGEYLHEN